MNFEVCTYFFVVSVLSNLLHTYHMLDSIDVLAYIYATPSVNKRKLLELFYISSLDDDDDKFFNPKKRNTDWQIEEPTLCISYVLQAC